MTNGFKKFCEDMRLVESRYHDKLPRSGALPYAPPRGYSHDKPCKASQPRESDCYKDANGRIWRIDRKHCNHWDVRNPTWRDPHSYMRVGFDGTILEAVGLEPVAHLLVEGKIDPDTAERLLGLKKQTPHAAMRIIKT